ncbi:MAG: SPOR domain-containing protein [Reyranellaceae bacterium]
MLRRFLLLAVFGPLAGCALPPALVVASYAADGMLLVTSGKTSTDHMLSMVEKRDCAVWRVVKNGEICQDFADGNDPYENWREPGEVQVAVQATDAGFPADLNDDIRRRNQAMREAQIARQQKAERIQVAQASAGQPVTSARDIVGPSNRTVMSDVSSAPLPPIAAEPAAAPVPVASTPPVPQPVVAAPAPIATAAPVAATPEPARTLAKGGKTYVVLGSFKVEENAKRVARQHQALKPTMQSVTVRGERYTRVVTGPYSAAQADAIKQRLKSQSVDAFTAAACDGKAAGRCIDASDG